MGRLDVESIEKGARIVWVSLGERSYPILIARGLLSDAGKMITDNLNSAHKCAIVTSPEITAIYGKTLSQSLLNARLDPSLILVPDGEESKSWEKAGDLAGKLVDIDLDRNSIIVSLGGGVIGDLAGFVSAIYLRGVRLVHIPTTLLGQVDSSIGGKTAVNHPKGKNLIGAFHQPSLVLIDPNLLRTLPLRELKSGLAEVVKYAVVSDVGLFRLLEERASELVQGDPPTLTEVIVRCCEIKAKLVELDERDTRGLRAALNYGHTVGHALDTLSGLRIRHGEAIAVGMVVASRIAAHLGMLSREDLMRQISILDRIGLSTELPEKFDALHLNEIMHHDKKASKGSVRFVLPTGIGKPVTLTPVSDELIYRALEGNINEA